MNPLVEIGKDGQCILWQPHLLAEALATDERHDLGLEPLLNQAGVSADLFKVESDHTSIRWEWGAWQRVEIGAEQGEGAGRPLTYTRAQAPTVGWRELPPADAVELTFYDTDDALGGRVKIEVPEAAHFGRDVEFSGPRGGAVWVKLLNSKNSGDLQVEWLRLDMRQSFKPKGEPIAFPAGETQIRVRVPSYFATGHIAVVRSRRGRRQLIGYAHYHDASTNLVTPDLSRSEGVKEFQVVRRWVEGSAGAAPRRLGRDATAEEWLDNWPSASCKRLLRVSERARLCAEFAGRDARKLMRDYPTGLLRYLALRACGHPSADAAGIVRLLDGHSFAAALNVALPALGGALPLLAAPEERAWAVRHADNPNLAVAAGSAAGQGPRALARALHLLDRRAEACAAWEARRREAAGT